MTDELKKNDRVYAQDGRQFCFDHIVGDFALCAPFFMVQILNHDGTDFDEVEEVAEHLERLRLSTISKKPWVASIHEETGQAIEAKRVEIAKIQAEAGAAMTALNVAKGELRDFEKGLAEERRLIEKKYDIVRRFNRLIGRDRVWYCFKTRSNFQTPADKFVPGGGELKYEKIVLRKSKASIDGLSLYILDDDDVSFEADFFPSEAEYQQFIRKLFHERGDRSPEVEVSWKKKHQFLTVSVEAQGIIDGEEAAARERKVESAREEVRRAEARLKSIVGDND